jgi:Glycosyl transferase family 2
MPRPARVYVSWLTNRLEAIRKRPWARCRPEGAAERAAVAAVTVSYNTVDITRQMLFSVFDSGVIHDIDELVVVDNGSRDGSLDYLEALADRELVTLLRNRWPPYHGPGLNRGMSYLAKRERACSIAYVWILDSDVIVVRGETLRHAVEVARAEEAAMVGITRPNGVHQLFALLVDPHSVWRRSVPPFQASGLPSARLERAVRDAGGTQAAFAFAERGDVVHLKAATGQSLVRMGKDRIPHARVNTVPDAPPEYGFESVPGAKEWYAGFLERFEARAAELPPPAFASLLAGMKHGTS